MKLSGLCLEYTVHDIQHSVPQKYVYGRTCFSRDAIFSLLVSAARLNDNSLKMTLHFRVLNIKTVSLSCI
jgi:hypothetical protein